MGTKFNLIYDCFYSKITDDMYMELDETQTANMTRDLLLNALPWFEFPRVNVHNYDLYNDCFNVILSNEEMNIIATYMIIEWINQQLASVEVTRMKYSGSDFKFTSQANHMSKLMSLKKEYERVGFHLQRLYKRRRVGTDGVMRSTMRDIMTSSVRGGNVPPAPPKDAVGTTGSRPEGTTGTGGTGDNTWEDMGGLKNPPSLDGAPSIGEGGWEDMSSIDNENNLDGWDKM